MLDKYDSSFVIRNNGGPRHMVLLIFVQQANTSKMKLLPCGITCSVTPVWYVFRSNLENLVVKGQGSDSREILVC
jgi:hypothetical protein